jgi:hypothetical protein
MYNGLYCPVVYLFKYKLRVQEIEVVPFILSLRAATLSHGKPAFTGTSFDVSGP